MMPAPMMPEPNRSDAQSEKVVKVEHEEKKEAQIDQKATSFTQSLFGLLILGGILAALVYGTPYAIKSIENLISKKESPTPRPTIGPTPKFATSIDDAFVLVRYTEEGKYSYSTNFSTISSQGKYPKVSLMENNLSLALDALSFPSEGRGNLRIVLHKSMFDTAGVPRIDVSGFDHLFVRGDQEALIESETLITLKPPPSIIAKVKGCCLFGRPPHLSSQFAEELSKRPFDSSNVKIASLFIDTGTARAIEASPFVNQACMLRSAKELKSENSLKKIFEEASGKTLLLLGHVEGSDYVIRTADESEQLRLSIAKIREMAKAYNVQLIDIGCKTTEAIQTDLLKLGVMTKYLSTDAIKSLEKALQNSRTLEDFLVNMSYEGLKPDKGLKIVIDQSFLDKPVKTASLYEKIQAKSRTAWVKVAQITFSYFK